MLHVLCLVALSIRDRHGQQTLRALNVQASALAWGPAPSVDDATVVKQRIQIAVAEQAGLNVLVDDVLAKVGRLG